MSAYIAIADVHPAPASVRDSVAWDEVALMARLIAVDPSGLGGLLLRGRAGPVRDQICAWVQGLLPAATVVRRIPVHVSDDRLLGGIALASTLRSGRIVWEQGLLPTCHGGLAVLPMAERLESRVVSQLCAVLDRGVLTLAREGVTAEVPCRLGLLVLDEGIGDEQVHVALRDRLALQVDLDALDARSIPAAPTQQEPLDDVRARLQSVTVGADAVTAMCSAAEALGIPSMRAALLAVRTACVHAALGGRTEVAEIDLALGARLVLGPLATRIPAPTPADDDAAQPDASDDAGEPNEPEPNEPESNTPQPDAPEPDAGPTDATNPDRDLQPCDDEQPPSTSGLEEIVLAAAKSGMPDGLLGALNVTAASRGATPSAGQAGASRTSTRGGRPAGARAAALEDGTRLAILDTLRAAAPWQRLRGGGVSSGPNDMRRIQVRREDFRIKQFQQRSETCVIFAVDASGSAALERLAEAKGAVEHLLTDCYVRRDHVALIAFRGTAADVVLPPTRSLARVRRRLADLAGGGTTPLAAGIDAAMVLANESRRRGQTPLVVMMTDGRGNVARDGRTGGAAPNDDALESSRRLRGTGVPSLVLDTSPRATPRVRLLAAEMNARYLALPYCNSAGVSREIRQLAQGGKPCR